MSALGLLVLMRIHVLAHDVVELRIVDQSTMLLVEEHELGRCQALHVRKVDVDEHEDDEHEHEVVMDDPHAHCATDQVHGPLERTHVHDRSPDAHASPPHDEDQDGDQQVRQLLRNAKLCSKRMILLQEQVVLDPFQSLMAVVLLRQP